MRTPENGRRPQRHQPERPLGLQWKQTLERSPTPEQLREALALSRDETRHPLDRAVIRDALVAHLLPVAETRARRTLRSSRTEGSARSELLGDVFEAVVQAVDRAPADVGDLRGYVYNSLTGAVAEATARDVAVKALRKRRQAFVDRANRLSHEHGRLAGPDLVIRDLEKERGRPLTDIERETVRLGLTPPRREAVDAEGALLLASGDPAGPALAATDAADAPLAEADRAADLQLAVDWAVQAHETEARRHLAFTVLRDKTDGPGRSDEDIGRLLDLPDPLIQPRFGSPKGLEAHPWPFWRRAVGVPDGVLDRWADVRAAFEGVGRTEDDLRKARGRAARRMTRVPRRDVSARALWRAAAAVALLFLGALAPLAQPATAVEALARAHRGSNEALLAAFDYAAYLRRVPYTDLDRVQRDRHTLWRLRDRGDDVGDRWVYALAEAFAREYPPSLATLATHVAIGETYLRGRPTQTVHGDAVYRVVGYYHLGRVARYLEAEAEAGRIDLDDVQPLVDRLAANDVYIERPESTLQKVWRNLRAGRIGYLWKRLWGGVADRRGRTAYTLRDAGQYGRGAAHAFSLWDGQAAAGHAVWLDRPALEAHYLARPGRHPSVADRATAHAHAIGRRPVVALAGGFTNAAGQPEGLTVDRGDVVNAILEPERHALVVVEAGGGIRVVDLDTGTVRVRDGARALTLRPFASLVDYGALLAWAKRHQATLFQTQLLAFGGRLRIDPAKAPREARERRLLALVRTPAGAVQHVVLDLTRPAALADAAQDAKDLLEARDLRVEALLNLDVGSYNVFQLWDDHGRPHPDVHGPTALGKATNLLLYTR